MCERHGSDDLIDEDLQEAADIIEAQDIPRPDLEAFVECLNKEIEKFDPKWDLSDDPMDQAKMAQLRREDLGQ